MSHKYARIGFLSFLLVASLYCIFSSGHALQRLMILALVQIGLWSMLREYLRESS